MGTRLLRPCLCKFSTYAFKLPLGFGQFIVAFRQ